MDAETPPDPHPAAEAADPDVKRFRFPTAFTVLAGILLVVWLASFLVPAGRYSIDPQTGGPKPGTYQRLKPCDQVPGDAACDDNSLAGGFNVLWDSPPNGLYGVEDSASGFVDVDGDGLLYGSAKIFLFVLAVGAFITVTMKTNAIQVGISRLALRFRNSEAFLIAVLMGVFALGGTTYGMWEETLGFFVLLVPLVLALGFDRMVGAAIILLGAGTGTLASTVNPFATGVASDAAGITVGDGIGLRIVMWLVLVPLAIGYVLRYARRVKAQPSRSVLGSAGRDPLPGKDMAITGEIPAMSTRQKVVLTIFFLCFAVMIYGFVPWNDIWQEVFDRSFLLPTFSNFYFAEASVLFLVASVVIGVIAGLGEEGTVQTIVSGAADFLGAALIIVLARAITVVMKDTYMTDTLLHSMENVVEGTSAAGFGVLAFLVNIPIAFLVPSSSGHAALVMPILSPLATFADVPKSVTVTAYQSASGFVNLITPTSAVVMGGLALSRIGYDRYLRFVLPYLAIVFVVCCIFMVIGASA